MEASAIPASVGLTRTRIAIGAPLLRIRSDEQLVSLFRAGSDEAFRVIHDRYRQRLFLYTRQMLGGSAADAEDAVQEIFVRAYAGLRASNRELALRAWLYRIAHNRCIDELRRLRPATTESVDTAAVGVAHDPVARVEQRDALRRLIDDVQRLPEQQRSALLMRELGGVAYADIAGALTVSVPAVKSLLVRARVGLAQANEARDTACAEIREDLILSHDRGVRTSGLARRHMRDCPSCRAFRGEVRGVSRRFAALAPTLGPIGVVAKLLGAGGGGGAAAGGMSGGGAAAAGGAAGTGAAAGAGLVGAGHVVTLLAAAVVTAGSAIELQQVSPPARHAPAHHRIVHASRPALIPSAPSAPAAQPAVSSTPALAASTPSAAPDATPVAQVPASTIAPVSGRKVSHSRSSNSSPPLLISQTADPDQLSYNQLSSSSRSSATAGDTGSTTSGAGGAGTATSTASAGSSTAAPGTTSSSAPAGADGAGAAGGTGAGATTSGQSTAASGGPATKSSAPQTGSGSGGTSTGGSASTPHGSGQVAAVFTTSQ